MLSTPLLLLTTVAFDYKSARPAGAKQTFGTAILA